MQESLEDSVSKRSRRPEGEETDPHQHEAGSKAPVRYFVARATTVEVDLVERPLFAHLSRVGETTRVIPPELHRQGSLDWAVSQILPEVILLIQKSLVHVHLGIELRSTTELPEKIPEAAKGSKRWSTPFVFQSLRGCNVQSGGKVKREPNPIK